MRSYLEESDNRQGWCLNRQSVVVGISGGRDSMALLHLLNSYAERVIAVHVNYGLRGKDSMEDEEFCIEFCKSINVELVVHRDFSISQSNKNVQSAARDIRYEIFETVRMEKGAKWIATAHHAQDNLEHFFLYLLRDNFQGAFEGIPIENESIIRPILYTPSEIIESYVSENLIEFRTDKSNFKLDYLRNKIRHWIIPMLKEELPSIDLEFCDISTLTMESKNNLLKEFNNDFDTKKLDRYFLEFSLNKIQKYRPIINQLLFKIGFSRDNIEKALSFNSKTGSLWTTDQFKIVKSQQNTILIYRNFEPQVKTLKLDEISSELLGFNIEFSSKIDSNWILRKVDIGDRFKFYGSRFQKKISDIFTDKKVNHFYRERSWILNNGEHDLALIFPEGVWLSAWADRNLDAEIQLLSC